MALAGGVSVSVPHARGYLYRRAGSCRRTATAARSTPRRAAPWSADGVGVVVLKRLREALADGDTIHAVIKGTAINNDGAPKVGYTAPERRGPGRGHRLAQAMAGVDPATIGYVEAHGTGTPLGDPDRGRGADAGVRRRHDGADYCAIGSVKTNIGHLDAAAGVAGLIKTVAGARSTAQIPPSLHFETPNPNIDFARSPFYVQRAAAAVASADGRAAACRRQLVRHRRHQRARGPRGGAGPAADGPVAAVAAAVAVGAHAGGAGRSDRTRSPSICGRIPNWTLADVAYTLQVGRKAFGSGAQLS